MKIIVIILLLVLLYASLSIAAVLKNGISLSNEPGIKQRLRVFLSTNRAATAEDHVFPELVTPVFNVSKTAIADALAAAVIELGWQTADKTSDDENAASQDQYHYIVATALFNFKDDVTIQLEERDAQVAMNIVSASRVGRADFGANLAHVQQLLTQLKKHIKE